LGGLKSRGRLISRGAHHFKRHKKTVSNKISLTQYNITKNNIQQYNKMFYFLGNRKHKDN